MRNRIGSLSASRPSVELDASVRAETPIRALGVGFFRVLALGGDDRVGDRQKLGLVAKQGEHLAIELWPSHAEAQGAIPCWARSARRRVSALWKRIFAAASLTCIALAMSQKDEPLRSFMQMICCWLGESREIASARARPRSGP